jgi:hypothetical protein
MDLRTLYTPQVGVPLSPLEKASPGAFAAPADQLERGGRELERVALQGLDAVRAAEDAKKAMEIRVEAGRIKSGFQVYLHESEAALRQGEPDPDAYYQGVQDTGRARMEQLLAGPMKYPELAGYLEPQLQQLLDQSRVQALTHRITKTKSVTNAAADATVRDLETLARATPIQDVPAWAGYLAQAETALQNTAPVNDPNAIGDAVTALRARWVTDRASAHMRQDPEGFQRDGPRLYGGLLGHGKLAELDEGATRRLEARARDEDRRQRELETRTERWLKKEQDLTAIEARKRYDAGTLTDEWLDEGADLGFITADKHEHFRTLLRKPPADVPIDPTLGADLVADVYGGGRTPTMLDQTMSRINALIRAGKLPYKGEPEKWLGHLETRIRHLQERAESEAERTRAQMQRAGEKAEREADRDQAKMEREAEREEARRRASLNAAHRQAEQMMAVDLRTTGPLEALTNEGRNVYGQALADLSVASGAEGMLGRQNPLEWWAANKTKYMARVATVADHRMTYLRGQTGGYQSATELLANRWKVKDPEVYYGYMRALRELDALSKERAALDAAIKGGKP